MKIQSLHDKKQFLLEELGELLEILIKILFLEKLTRTGWMKNIQQEGNERIRDIFQPNEHQSKQFRKRFRDMFTQT